MEQRVQQQGRGNITGQSTNTRRLRNVVPLLRASNTEEGNEHIMVMMTTPESKRRNTTKWSTGTQVQLIKCIGTWPPQNPKLSASTTLTKQQTEITPQNNILTGSTGRKKLEQIRKQTVLQM